jgi:hypothetical protein
MNLVDYDRLWDETRKEWRSAKAPRSLVHNHPIMAEWLADDARGFDPAFNPLYFRYRSRFRNPTSKRRLRLFNTLLLALKEERFALALGPDRDDTCIVVGTEFGRTCFSITADEVPTIGTALRKKFTGRLRCHIDAKLPRGIEDRWADETGTPLEARLPNILASFAVWAEQERYRISPR